MTSKKRHRQKKKKRPVSKVAANNSVPLADNNISTSSPTAEKQPLVSEHQHQKGKAKEVESIFFHPENNVIEILNKINTSVLKFPVRARLSSGLVRIKPKTVDDQCSLLHFFIENKVPFHTLAPKAEQPKKVLIRGLPPLTNPDVIEKFLCKSGFFPISIKPLHHQKTKKPLPLFLVNLKPMPGWERIYEINNILCLTVKIQKFNSPGMKQCYRCQGSNHSSLTCSLPPRCVSCAGPHTSDVCTRPKSEPATCFRCGGNHPANYRGCPKNRAQKCYMVQPCNDPAAERVLPRNPVQKHSLVQTCESSATKCVLVGNHMQKNPMVQSENGCAPKSR